jgi:CheY-like chemotaxis protein
LSIVKGYSDLLGGRIRVASTLERGSTFTVEWPFRLPSDPASGRPLAVGIPPGRRAWVVDERASFRASVTARLASLGITVQEYAQPPAVLITRSAEAEPHDVLIVENLSLWQDSDLLAALRAFRRWAPILVALEPRYDVDVDQRLRRAGLTHVLWSGATRAQWSTTLAQAFQEVVSEAVAEPGSVVLFPPPLPLPLTGQTVLVVEDYAINRMIMAHQLRGNGARVLEAGDGDTAVALAAESGIDLILMDIQMPGKDGIAAIQDIRQWPAGRRLPILGFTASADKPTHQRILAAGADGVLTKPISEAHLVRAVRRALRRHRQQGD